MWMVDPTKNLELQPRPSVYVAPSSSWASVNWIVAFGGDGRYSNNGWLLTEVLSYETTLENEDIPTGKVVGSILCIPGPVRETRWTGTTLWDGTDERRAMPIGKVWMDAMEDAPEVASFYRWVSH